MMRNFWRSGLLVLLLVFLLSLSACDGRSNYDRGYEDAMSGKNKSVLYSVNEGYRNGYDDGFERADVEDCWDFHGHNLEKAAYELGISVRELKLRLDEYDLW